MIRLKGLLKTIPGVYWLWTQYKSFPKNARNRYLRIKTLIVSGRSLPPPELMFLVAGTDDIEWFLDSGKTAYMSMLAILGNNGIQVQSLAHILDFGCGSGRVMRYWPRRSKRDYFGADYNQLLIDWCRKHLKFAHFLVNPLAGHIDFADQSFDFIYALSVFTHLQEEEQHFWMDELNRILIRGGYLFITVHGKERYLPQLAPVDQGRFLNGELIVYGKEHEGTNICTAFHPESYVRNKLARSFEVVDFVPEGALGNPYQDVYLLKKTG